MAKKKKETVYKLFPSSRGDLYTVAPSFRKNGSGKFELTKDLTQQELKYLYELGHTNIIYKIEG